MLTNHPSSLTVPSQPINMCWLNRKHLSIVIALQLTGAAFAQINIYGHFIEDDPVTLYDFWIDPAKYLLVSNHVLPRGYVEISSTHTLIGLIHTHASDLVTKFLLPNLA